MTRVLVLSVPSLYVDLAKPDRTQWLPLVFGTIMALMQHDKALSLDIGQYSRVQSMISIMWAKYLSVCVVEVGSCSCTDYEECQLWAIKLFIR